MTKAISRKSRYFSRLVKMKGLKILKLPVERAENIKRNKSTDL